MLSRSWREVSIDLSGTEHFVSLFPAALLRPISLCQIACSEAVQREALFPPALRALLRYDFAMRSVVATRGRRGRGHVSAMYPDRSLEALFLALIICYFLSISPMENGKNRKRGCGKIRAFSIVGESSE